jgi:chromosome segregation ATPase
MKWTSLIVVASVMLGSIQNAAAESVRRGGGESSGSAQQMQQMQQLAVERDALRAKNDQLEADNANMSKELNALKAKFDATGRENASLKTKLMESERVAGRAQETGTATADKLKDTQDRLQKVVDKYKELVENLRKSEEYGAALQAGLGQQSDSLQQCAKDNQTLYQTSLELLQRYENKGVWEAMLQHEPVTQLKRVELESLGETYRDRTEQHKFQPQVDASTP